MALIPPSRTPARAMAKVTALAARGLPPAAEAAREGPGEHPVERERLQGARRPEQRSEGAREGCRPDARDDERPPAGDLLHDQRLGTQQGGVGDHHRQEDRDREVGDVADDHRGDRPEGERAPGVLEVPRHRDPGFDAGHRGKEDGEHHPEGVARRRRRRRREPLRRGGPAREERDEREGDQDHDHVLQAQGEIRGKRGHHRERHERADPHQQRMCEGEDPRERLREPRHVEGDAEGLREIERDPDRRPPLHAERARDEEIGAAAADAHVRGESGERERGDEGDGTREGDDQHRAQEAHVPEHPAEAQVHDHAEHGEDARREDTLEGPEPVPARRALARLCHRPFLAPLRDAVDRSRDGVTARRRSAC